jgi:hypothetical protein
MMTINEVPTKTPIPIVEMRRNCDCDKAIDNGSAPAKKELEIMSNSKATIKVKILTPMPSPSLARAT